MTRTETASDGVQEEDKLTETLHQTVQSYALFGEPPDITEWLQRRLLFCAGLGNVKNISETFKYKRKFRMKLDWTDYSGESAIIRAWKFQQHEAVKRLRRRGASTFRINILEAIQEHKDLYCQLMIKDRPSHELLLPELELSIIHDTTDVTDVILKRQNIIDELKQGTKGSAASMLFSIMTKKTSYDKSKVAEEFVDTLATYFIDVNGYAKSHTRRALVHLGLKCCLPKFAISILQKKNLRSIDYLMEDMAALSWKLCPWACNMLESLYKKKILQPHSLAHSKLRTSNHNCLFNRRDSVAKRSMFNDSCCSPLREALEYCNPDMLRMVLTHGDIDICAIFSRLAQQVVHQLIPFYLSTCVVEKCWEFAMNSIHSRNATSMMIQLLEQGFIPDVCFANETNILGTLIQRHNGQKWYRQYIRIVIGGCWRPGRIHTKVLMPHGTAFIDSIVSSALNHKKPFSCIPMLLDAGLNLHDLSFVVSATERIQLFQYKKLRKMQSLKAACRVTIRRWIPMSFKDCKARSMYHAVDTLPIPEVMKRFLVLQE